MKAIGLAKAQALAVTECPNLVGTNWDSIAEVSEALQLALSQEAELDQRLEAYRENPTADSPWPEVGARILNPA